MRNRCILLCNLRKRVTRNLEPCTLHNSIQKTLDKDTAGTMADYRLLPGSESESDHSGEEMAASDEDECIGKKTREPKSRKKPGRAIYDPILGVIGEFGPYQAWICFVGFLMNMVHAWLSLSLKSASHGGRGTGC